LSGSAKWSAPGRYVIDLSPNQYLKLITFDDLSLGEEFEVTPRINLTAILDVTKPPQDIGTYIENRKVTSALRLGARMDLLRWRATVKHSFLRSRTYRPNHTMEPTSPVLFMSLFW